MNGVQATLIGNVTRDPELRWTANNGTPWVSLRVATNRRISGEEDETLFWDVTLWRHTAEYAARAIRTGMGVYAQGTFSLRSYTRDDGTVVTVPCLSATDFEIVTRGPAAAESWLENRPARENTNAPADPPPARTAAPAQAPQERRQGGANMEQRQPQRPVQRDRDEDRPAREPAREPARDREPAPTRTTALQPQRSDDDPPFEPPEEPNYSPAFYDED